MWVGYGLSNAIALSFVYAAWQHPLTGRLLYSLLFLLASGVNFTFSYTQPDIYQMYADTCAHWFRPLITDVLADHAGLYIALIAGTQSAVAMLLYMRSAQLRRVGMAIGIAFLVFIAIGPGQCLPQQPDMGSRPGSFVAQQGIDLAM